MNREQDDRAAGLAALIEAELALVRDLRVLDCIRGLLVPPYPVERLWDGDEDDRTLPCWTVLEHAPGNTAIAWCGQGFGPVMPWGVVELRGTPADMSMGLDFNWSFTFLRACCNSAVCAELPIWRVYEGRSWEFGGYSPVTGESPWREACAAMEALRQAHPERDFDCNAEEFVRVLRRDVGVD